MNWLTNLSNKLDTYSRSARLTAAAILSGLIYLLIFTLPFLLPRFYNTIPPVDYTKLTGYSIRGFWLYAFGILALFGLYIWAIRLCAPARSASAEKVRKRHVFVGGASFTLILIFSYPLTAIDLFIYAIRTRGWALYNLPPLSTPPEALPSSDPWLGLAGEWVDAASPYGPVWEWLSLTVFYLSSGTFLFHLFALKIVAALAYLGSAWLVYKILKRLQPQWAVAGTVAFAWNPLVLFESIQNAHNDIVMAFFLLAAIWMLGVREGTADGAGGGGTCVNLSNLVRDKPSQRRFYPPHSPLLGGKKAPPPGKGRLGGGQIVANTQPQTLKLTHKGGVPPLSSPRQTPGMKPTDKGFIGESVSFLFSILVCFFLALSILVKFVTIIVVPFFLLGLVMQQNTWFRRLGAWVGYGAITAVLIIVPMLPFWPGRENWAVLKAGSGAGRSLLALLVLGLRDSLGTNTAFDISRNTILAIFALIYLYLLWKTFTNLRQISQSPNLLTLRSHSGQVSQSLVIPISAAFYTLFLYVLLAAPVFHAWYLLWFLPLAPLLLPKRRPLSAGIVFSMTALLIIPYFETVRVWYPALLQNHFLGHLIGVPLLIIPPILSLIWPISLTPSSEV